MAALPACSAPGRDDWAGQLFRRVKAMPPKTGRYRPRHLRALCKAIFAALVLQLCVSSAQAGEKLRTPVVVATESWGQLMYLDGNGAPKGVLADFINRMNVVQEKFQFQLSIYPRLRLDKLFADKEADVYPLRTTLWVS